MTDPKTQADVTVSDVLDEIRTERQRQVEVEGWTAEHDDDHIGGQLARAGAAYAIQGSTPHGAPEFYVTAKGSHAGTHGGTIGSFSPARLVWPWSFDWWKPKGQRRNLIRAAALIVAEIERLDRKAVTDD